MYSDKIKDNSGIYYFYYELGFEPNIYQFFDYNLKSEFINRTFLITYNGGYEDGYTIG